MYKKVPGTKDLLPQEVSYWQKIEETAKNIFLRYHYQEIRTPLIENLSLFNRSLGEFTEIVQKQMFIIKNKEDTYCLRPEGTASILRAYIENNLDKTLGFSKFYYLGPMFRLERPQKGRLRQFHHIGVEAIGSAMPELDVEVVGLADTLLKAWGINDAKITLNSLGCLKDKKELMKLLAAGLKDKLKSFCAACQARFNKNVLRILDCKNESCQEIVKTTNLRGQHLCSDCKTHFQAVKDGLDSQGISYQVNPLLVRGLDYYTRTVFEVRHQNLGAQDALCAGGRYDNLAKELGGPDVGAVGFAFGIERVMLAVSCKLSAVSKNLVYLITLGKEAKTEGIKLLSQIRSAGIASDTDYENKSLKGAMRKASDLGAKFVVILGEDELKKGVITLKDMESGEQREIRQEELIMELARS